MRTDPPERDFIVAEDTDLTFSNADGLLKKLPVTAGQRVRIWLNMNPGPEENIVDVEVTDPPELAAQPEAEIGPNQRITCQPTKGQLGKNVLGKITPVKRRIVKDPKTGEILEDRVTYPGGLVRDTAKPKND